MDDKSDIEQIIEQKRGQVPFSTTYSPLFVRLKRSYDKKAVLTTERTKK